MAEAIFNHDMAGPVCDISAGTRQQPAVEDGAIEALKQAGLPTAGLPPKDVDSVLDDPIDLIISVWDNARGTCRIFPRGIWHIHLRFHDPHAEPLASFVAERNDTSRRLVPAVRQPLTSGDP